MNSILNAWNALDRDQAVTALLSCCAARRWAEELTAHRPYATAEDLFKAADRVWTKMEEPDWLEAFRAHPRIGERKAAHATAQSTQWSHQEQSAAEVAREDVLAQLADGNLRYEQLFGFTYIVYATGKSGEEMLKVLEQRLAGDRQSELREAAEQQRQITQIRLRKWLVI
jgi:2-oxo-4-hydroxy-4-carboxy-5-ureidoimidazoline decarboxylase